MDKRLLRVLDVNYNRAKEALRVLEDIFRFIWENKPATKKTRDIRHKLTDIFKDKAILKKMLKERNAQKDIGRRPDKLEMPRKDIDSLRYANFQRAKESLRVLEEILKLIDKKSACKMKYLRYNCYSLEQYAEEKRPVLSDN